MCSSTIDQFFCIQCCLTFPLVSSKSSSIGCSAFVPPTILSFHPSSLLNFCTNGNPTATCPFQRLHFELGRNVPQCRKTDDEDVSESASPPYIDCTDNARLPHLGLHYVQSFSTNHTGSHGIVDKRARHIFHQTPLLF